MKTWFSRHAAKAMPAETSNFVGLPNETSSPVEALIQEGQSLEDGGELEAALLRYQKVTVLAPGLPAGWLNQGNALQLQGHVAKAVESYRQALSLDQHHAGAWLNLGNALLKLPAYTQEEHRAAIAEGEAAYRAALHIRPEWGEAWFGLGCALEISLPAEDACAAYRRALELDPAHEGARFNLDDLTADMLVKRKEVAAARRVITDALSRMPGHRRLLSRLADLERDSGRLREGLIHLKRLVDEQPDDFAVHSVFLFSLNYAPELSAQEVFEAHRRFGQLMEQRIAMVPAPQPRSPHKRLRVGYLSPDFYQHAVAVFMIPVLRQHDRERVEVICYHCHQGGDDITARIRSLADGWRDIAKLDDEAAARQIVADEIDVLIDLAGHTGGGRLSLFARKPAPVQITWLGYIGTTGLSRMDYRLCDGYTDPVGQAESWHTEALLRMPDSQWCYEPQSPVPLPGPLPYLSRGYWTFGSYNNSLKLNSELLAAWAAVMRQFPTSRLKVFSIQNEEIDHWVRSTLTRHGITTNRVDLVCRLTMDEYFASSCDVDVALDSFPYTGGTTTCDTLLMGLPVVTTAGRRSIERSGASLLYAIGLEDWISPTMQALPSVLNRQLADVERVADLRASLPDRMRNSPLMDAKRFVTNLENQFDIAWQGKMSDRQA